MICTVQPILRTKSLSNSQNLFTYWTDITGYIVRRNFSTLVYNLLVYGTARIFILELHQTKSCYQSRFFSINGNAVQLLLDLMASVRCCHICVSYFKHLRDLQHVQLLCARHNSLLNINAENIYSTHTFLQCLTWPYKILCTHNKAYILRWLESGNFFQHFNVLHVWYSDGKEAKELLVFSKANNW